MKGWELMCVLVGTFSPSKHLAGPLREFLVLASADDKPPPHKGGGGDALGENREGEGKEEELVKSRVRVMAQRESDSFFAAAAAAALAEDGRLTRVRRT